MYAISCIPVFLDAKTHFSTEHDTGNGADGCNLGSGSRCFRDNLGRGVEGRTGGASWDGLDPGLDGLDEGSKVGVPFKSLKNFG